MIIDFEKYQGAGNYFVIVDDRNESFAVKETLEIQKLCDRNFGIGADGLILLRNSERSDFQMLYFNADGHPGSLCGNGSRCAYAFAYKHGLVGRVGTFEASDGLHKAFISDDGLVSMEMSDVLQIEKQDAALFLNTGSPHHLECVEKLSEINVKEQGAFIRYGAPYFEAGTNVNFVEKVDADHFNIRTYERGVEDETLACGTGAVAAAIGVHYLGLTPSCSLKINALGGQLQVSFTSEALRYKNIQLKGPAVFVFSGNYSTV